MRNSVSAVIFALTVLFSSLVMAYDNHGYPYAVTSGCRETCYVDAYSFCKNNCTSYSAYMLNQYGVPFDNSYKNVTWSHGKYWNDRASDVGISVDNFPLPGDIAYWDNIGDTGHVAWVEKVYYDTNGNATAIDITEYNYNYCVFGERAGSTRLNVGSSSYPNGFIHILAYNEGVTSLHYLDCSEAPSLCGNQTAQEWQWIVNRVWNNYRCTNCTSNYDSNYISAVANAIGGMGGGSGTSTQATDTTDPGKPDFIVNKIWLEDLNGNETYTFDRGDEIKIRMILKNIGSDDIPGSDTITTRIYLSDGYKVDPSDNWIRIGNETTLGSELDPGETHSETEYFKLWEESHIQVGKTYNLVVCVDRTADHNNGIGAYAEEHESNNCSTEAVFTVNAATAPVSEDLSWLPAIIGFILDED